MLIEKKNITFVILKAPKYKPKGFEMYITEKGYCRIKDFKTIKEATIFTRSYQGDERFI